MNPLGEGSRCRGIKLAARLFSGKPVTSAYIREVFGVSWATAKRDLTALQYYLPVKVRAIPGKGCAVVHELKLEAA